MGNINIIYVDGRINFLPSFFVTKGWFYPLVRGVDKQIFCVVILLKERGGEKMCDNALGVKVIEVSVLNETDGKF